MINKRKNKALLQGNDGSSLAIALVFFLLCSIICASIIALANSSVSSVAKNYDADTVETSYNGAPIPDPTESVPTPDPLYPDDSAAVTAIYNILYADLNDIYNTVEKGDVKAINKSPTTITYEIFSYINFYFENTKQGVDQNKVFYHTTDPDHPEYGEIIVRDFTITLTGQTPVKVTLIFTNTDGSIGDAVGDSKPGCMQFKTVMITIESTNTACKYKRYITFEFSDKCYFKSYSGGSGGYHFNYQNHEF